MSSEKENRYLAAKEKLQANIKQLVEEFDRENGIERTVGEREHLYRAWDAFKSELLFPLPIKLSKEE